MKEKIFTINTNPVYCVDISKSVLFNLCPNIVKDDDIFKMMALIKVVLNSTKPAYVYNMVLSRKEDYCDNLQLYLSGKDFNEDLIFKIINVWEKMISTYNSENLNYEPNLDLMDYDEMSEYFMNSNTVKEDFLKKFAATYWFDLELGDASGVDKKVSKI